MNNDFERINQSSQAVIDWSFRHQKEKERNYISLPVFDAPFLKALQVPLVVTENQEIKIQRPLFKNINQLESNSVLLFSEDAFSCLFEVIDSVREKNLEQKIVYKIPNLFHIMEAVLPFDQLVLSARKYPDLYGDVMNQVISFMHKIIKKLDDKQVDIIYFFDSFGSYQLLGSNFYKKFYGEFILTLFSIEEELSYAVLSMTKAIAVPLQKSYGLIENKKSRIYLSNQKSKGTIELTKAVSFNKKGAIHVNT